jgi:hypothetical protein
MSTRNYLLISNDLTATEKREYRLTALAGGYEACVAAGIGNLNADIPTGWDGNPNTPGLQSIPEANKKARVDLIKKFLQTGMTPSSIDQRELMFLAGNDLVVATLLDSWLTAPLAAVGGFYSCFQAIAAPQLVQGKLMCCYGVSVESVSALFPVSRLIFRRGGAAGNIRAQFDMEEMGVRLEPDAFFSEPVVQEPQEVFAIQVRASVLTGIAEKVHIHNFLYETHGLVTA